MCKTNNSNFYCQAGEEENNERTNGASGEKKKQSYANLFIHVKNCVLEQPFQEFVHFRPTIENKEQNNAKEKNIQHVI